LDRLADGMQHQGVVLRCRARPALDESNLKTLLATFKDRDSPPLLLVLERVQDPHNLGACLRTCDAAGVAALMVGRHEAAGRTPTVEKVACGASVPLIQVGNLARSLTGLKDAGLWLVGTAPGARKTLYDCDLRGPTALVMGGEAGGLRRLTRELCDHLIRIPMVGTVESLNISVAAAICIYEALRQRRMAS
jgi:23S rRNA (guanosine2251-2'-O)-methyltransferase